MPGKLFLPMFQLAWLTVLADRPSLDDVLRSPLRARMMKEIAAQPGIPLRVLANRLTLHQATLHHHLGVLERSGHLRSHRAGRRRIYFSAADGEAGSSQERALLLETTSRRVAAAIAANPGYGINELVQGLGETQRVVYHHVKRLREAGLVTSESRVRHRRLSPTSRLLVLLAET